MSPRPKRPEFVYVATVNESNEGGMVLGVRTTMEAGQALCEQDASDRKRVAAPWFADSMSTWTNGGVFWQVERFRLEGP